VPSDIPCGDHILGVVESQWSYFAGHTEDGMDESQNFLQTASTRHSPGMRIFGYIHYKVIRHWQLVQPLQCQSLDPQYLMRLIQNSIVVGTDRNIGEILSEWRINYRGRAPVIQVASLCPKLALLVFGAWLVFHVVPVTARTNRARILGDSPSTKVCHRLKVQGIEVVVPGRVSLGEILKRNYQRAPADLVIDWLQVTKAFVIFCIVKKC
jgi:hypothetical protein